MTEQLALEREARDGGARVVVRAGDIKCRATPRDRHRALGPAHEQLARAGERLEMRRRIGQFVATLALDEQIRPVNFDQPLGRRAGAAMEAVDILRHDRRDFPRAFERHDRVMNGIGLRALIHGAALELEVPVLDARRFG